jgi:pimeloyl-ACP methyl ester carboxylesterase
MTALDPWPAPTNHRSGGQTLSLRRLGVGPKLLMLHGGPGLDHHLLLPLALELEGRFEVWLPDLPGHGRSHPPGRGLPDLNRLLENLARWVEDLSPPVELIAGHSLGAWIARELIRSRSVRPRAAVLIAPPVGNRRARTTHRRPWAIPRPDRRRRERNLREEILEFCRGETSRAISPAMRRAVAVARLRPPESYVALQGQLRKELDAPIPALPAECATLMICGEADPISTPAEVAELSRATPGSTLIVLPGAGHVPFAGDAGPVARAMLAFLEPRLGGTIPGPAAE